MNLEGFESVKRWITKLGKKSDSPNTRRLYFYALERFCEYVGMNPDELVAERRRNLESRDEFTRRHAEDKIDEWFLRLTKTVSPKTGKELSRNTCVSCYQAVRSFYKANRSKLEPEDPPASWVTKAKPGLTREELKDMLDHTDNLMHRAYVLCQVQSGLSVSDLLRLTVNDINETEPGYIHLYLTRGKEKHLGFFDTFFGKTATATLKEYLKTRKLNPTSKLIPCTPQNVRHFLAKLSDKAGLDWKVGTHTLRKYFYTNLSLARVNSPAFNDTLIEFWMGHSLGKVKGAYFIPPVEEQLRLYKLAETRLEPD